MSWRGSREDWRRRCVEKTDPEEAEAYEALVGSPGPDDEEAYAADLRRVVALRPGMRVLDVGAGTGTLARILLRFPELSITALEPAPAMLARLTGKADLSDVVAVEGFCDGPEDRTHFAEGSFDAIVSRQAVNMLFDPLTAFANWLHWLAPGGVAVAIDGLYERAAWTGRWEEAVDVLPLAACRTTALLPYLLESVGYRIDHVGPMTATNARPSTRTPRYVVVAHKTGAAG